MYPSTEPSQLKLSEDIKTEIVKSYLEKDLNGRPLNNVSDLVKVYGVGWHAIRLILDKAGIPRRTRSEVAMLAFNRPEVKERHRRAGRALWEDSEKRTHMLEGMNRPEVKERHRRAQVLAHSRPETKQRHSEVALAMWTERKRKLAEAERILAQRTPGQMKEAARITLAACLRLRGGVSKYEICYSIYPEQNIRSVAVTNGKKFMRRKKDEIAAEERRLRNLDEVELDAARETASAYLAHHLQ